MVLDAPFIFEKQLVQPASPLWLNNYILDNYNYLSSEDKKVIDEQLYIYKSSYLYSEPEYACIRVLKTVLFENNPHLSTILPDSIWIMKDQLVYNENHLVIKPKRFKGLKLNAHIPHRARQFIGANYAELKNGNGFQRWQSLFNVHEVKIDSLLSTNELIVKNDTLFSGNLFVPDSFIVKGFTAVIKKTCQDGGPIFKDQNFYYPMELDTINTILNSSSFQVTGFRIKEDYYINPYTREIESLIIGIGIICNGQKKENEVFWLYYPWYQYALENFYNIVNGEIINYVTILNNHRYNQKITDIINFLDYNSDDSTISSYNHLTDLEYMVKLQPLLAIRLLQEQETLWSEKNNTKQNTNFLKPLNVKFKNKRAVGKITEYFHNGNISFTGEMKDGRCQGVFKFYFPSGDIKAIRNYNNGQLINQQQNYYPNGQIYARYTVEDDFEIISSLERYYEDGSLLEKGKFAFGLPIGKWSYRFKCSEVEFLVLKNNNIFPSEFKTPSFNSDTFEYTLFYSQSIQKDLFPINYGKETLRIGLDIRDE